MTLNSLTSTRALFLISFLVCLGLMGFGMYLQHVKNLEPCPLCIMQRYAFIAVGMVGLIAAVHNPRGWGRVIYALLMLIGAGLGAGVAGRQIWLQYHPQPAVQCGPGLDYMMESFPLSQVLPMLFKGEGDCGKIVWQFLGFSIPEWAMVWFVIFIVMSAWIAFRKPVRTF